MSFDLAPLATHAGNIVHAEPVDERGYISCTATRNNYNYLTVWSSYYHQQGVLILKPSLSLTGFNVTLSSNYQMELMVPNPYLHVPF